MLDNFLKKALRAAGASNVKMMLLGLGNCFDPLRNKIFTSGDSGVRSIRQSYDHKKISRMVEQWFAKVSNMRYNVTMDELAMNFGISKRCLMDYFQNSLKIDFRSFKTARRIEYAKEMLLENGDLSVVYIASRLGFKDKSNFHRQFKKEVGCTPCQWRNCGGHTEVLAD